jgi:hypothetical protein
MSYIIDSFGRYELGDDELASWLSKLKKEFADSKKGFLAALDAKLKNCKNYESICEDYKFIRQDMENAFEQLSADLSSIIGKKYAGTVNINEVTAIKAALKDKIENFDQALTKMQGLVNKEMYDSKLDSFFLKLKAILLGIVNCLLDRDLQSDRRTVIGEGFASRSVGPAFYSTPVYILPDRPEISKFFSGQISQKIDNLEEYLFPKLK